KRLHGHGMLEGRPAHDDLVAGPHLLRGLGALAVHRHVAGGDRLDRQRARLEETRGPQPLVDAHQPSRRTSCSVTGAEVPVSNSAPAAMPTWATAAALFARSNTVNMAPSAKSRPEPIAQKRSNSNTSRIEYTA